MRAPLRQCAVLIIFIVCAAGEARADDSPAAVSVKDGKWYIDGAITYPGTPAEGLLMNVRMVNATFEDMGPEAKRLPEGYTPDANTDRFISSIPLYVEQGVRAFTLSLMGGRPGVGYEGAVNSAFEADGSLRPEYLERMKRVIEACRANKVAVILTCLYQNQHSHDRTLTGRDAVMNAVSQAALWIREQGFKNVMLEIANEYRVSGFSKWKDGEWLRSAEGQAELIRHARSAYPGLLVSTAGVEKLPREIAEAADYLTIHFNDTALEDYKKSIEALKPYGKAIVVNEDDKTGADGARAAELCVENGASWGFMHKEKNQYTPFEFDGAQDDPAVYGTLKRLTNPKR